MNEPLITFHQSQRTYEAMFVTPGFLYGISQDVGGLAFRAVQDNVRNLITHAALNLFDDDNVLLLRVALAYVPFRIQFDGLTGQLVAPPQYFDVTMTHNPIEVPNKRLRVRVECADLPGDPFVLTGAVPWRLLAHGATP